MLPLLPLSGQNGSSLIGMSGDGSRCAGFSSQRQPGMEPTAGPDAVIWDASGTVRSLAEALTSSGVDLGGGHLSTVTVTRDGNTFLGQGLDPTGFIAAFVARLP